MVETKLDSRVQDLLTTDDDANLQLALVAQTHLCNGNEKKANIMLRNVAYNMVTNFDDHAKIIEEKEHYTVKEVRFGTLVLQRKDARGRAFDIKEMKTYYTGEVTKLWTLLSTDEWCYYKGPSEYLAKLYMRQCIKRKFKGGDMFRIDFDD